MIDPGALQCPERTVMPQIHRYTETVVKTGISFGSALAIAISWSTHKSIIWAIIHGFFSWFYVAWYALTR